jgi:hypothetical protein
MQNNFSGLAGLEGALIGLAVLVFFIARQFSARPVASLWTFALPVVLAYFGLQGLGDLDAGGVVVLGLNLAVGVALGFMRGVSIRVWTDHRGEALMRGTALTLALWLATLAVKVGISLFESRVGLGTLAGSNAEIWLPAAATIAVQSLVVYLRSLDLRPAVA